MNDGLPPDQIRRLAVTRANDPRVLHAWAGRRMAEAPLEGLKWARRARVADPLAPPPRHREALALWTLGRTREAETAGLRGLLLAPGDGPALINFGNAKKRHGEDALALRLCGWARAAGAPAHMADMNAALLHLRHGDFVRGWPLYRARHRMLGADPATIWPELPEWDGRPIAGRLRLITEQGIGDTIMFLTLLAAVRPRVGAVTLLVTARLTAPIQRSFPDIQVIAPDTDRSLGPLPPAEAWICAGDLPAVLGLSNDGPVRPAPYLTADGHKRRTLRDRLQRRHPDKRLIGITWTSQAEDGWRRTVAPTLWHALSDLPDVALISLQYRASRGDLAAFGDRLEVDHGIEPFDDLDGLTALVAAMDVVVSPPNNTVHFAGALGLPCHVMLPVDPDWRWGLGREDSLWYPRTRLFRQQRDGDWAPVVARVATALRHWPDRTVKSDS
ncbi:hypothetical protein T8K17_21770 [Thalassobaculum sp. OXR-137]|uniref:hypothetical protein n=1 Tax=Thalassobaculum sp. OXR-137 TaxID=3100173 RepID=UPI002AC9EE75|nr:hypothetical protein [Thalassobaculum sp. OXR-137]WPZ33853.1 hypothetical protein T8K17_21770 [Thalassobaculum sp. OXR-137]